MLVSTLIAIIGLASSARAWGGLGTCRIPFLSLAPLYPHSHLSPVLDAASKRLRLGHKTAANVALQFLPENVVSSLNAILAADSHKKFPNPTIVDIAPWADDFSHMPSGAGDFSKEYHYIDAQDDPPFECNIDLRRDCSGAGGCVVKAMWVFLSTWTSAGSRCNSELNILSVMTRANYTERLVAPDGNPDNMADALKFLVHFVADVTQPLHAEAIARGGNDITVKWNGHQKKLHGGTSRVSCCECSSGRTVRLKSYGVPSLGYRHDHKTRRSQQRREPGNLDQQHLHRDHSREVPEPPPSMAELHGHQ